MSMPRYKSITINLTTYQELIDTGKDMIESPVVRLTPTQIIQLLLDEYNKNHMAPEEEG